MRIFISRKISNDSPFKKLEGQGHEIIDQSLIQINLLDFELIDSPDWIFFYSSTGVKLFLEKYSYSEKQNYAVMGAGTAKTFERLTGRKPQFIGDGNAQHISEFFISHHLNDRIVFIKALNSIGQVQNHIGDKLKVANLPIYRTIKLYHFDLAPCDVLLFTSPLNAEAYFDKYGYHSEKMFAIGASTAQKIYGLIKHSVHYCENPNEDNLYALLRRKLVL